MNFKYIIIIITLSVTAVFAAITEPKQVFFTKNNIDELSREIPGWKNLREVDMDYEKYTGLAPDSLIFRDYINDKGQIVTLVVVYHINNRWGAHDPNVCYTSQGWKIMGKDSLDSVTINNKKYNLNKLTIKNSSVESLVYYYWFSSNKKITASRNKQMLDMVVNGLINGYTESGFVRVSVNYAEVDNNNPDEILKSFLKSFTPQLESVL